MTHIPSQETHPKTPDSPAAKGFLQRKCACGRHKSSDGECSECKKKRQTGLQRAAIKTTSLHKASSVTHEPLPCLGQLPGAETSAIKKPPVGHDLSNVRVQAAIPRTIQAKLVINQPGDVYEQEAEHVAEQIMRMPAPASQHDAPQFGAGAAPRSRQRKEGAAHVHRKAVAPAAMDTNEVPEPFLHSLGPGQPLAGATRDFFEPRFGCDFTHVRVHTDAAAADSARAVNALAYTVGQNVVFGAGQYAPEIRAGQRLLAHELTHVVQQGGAPTRATGSINNRNLAPSQKIGNQSRSLVSNVIQRAGDPAAIPTGFLCPTDLSPGRPAGTDLLFTTDDSGITAAHTAALTAFRATWLAAGGTDDILIHGYASTDGDQAHNWTLSCNRAQVVQAELIRLGIPSVRINIVAHGESTDFGPGPAANRHAVVSTSSGGVIPLPLVTGSLTARDNFAGRSSLRFGVGEVIDLNFLSFPARPAADFGGLEWHLVSGGGALTAVTNAGTATYTAPAAASAVTLELRVAAGATAGRVISTHAITIVIPSSVRMTEVPGTPPSFGGAGGSIPAGTWGAGFQANVFVNPKDVSFQGVVFGEGTVAGVVTPAGSFLSPFAGRVHPVNTFGPGHAGNAATGTPVSPPVDNIFQFGVAPTGSLLGVPVCGVSDFLWAIPWEFSVAGGARTPFAGGFTANHHITSTLFCNAVIDKGGAGPFCRRIDGTTC